MKKILFLSMLAGSMLVSTVGVASNGLTTEKAETITNVVEMDTVNAVEVLEVVNYELNDTTLTNVEMSIDFVAPEYVLLETLTDVESGSTVYEIEPDTALIYKPFETYSYLLEHFTPPLSME